MCDVLWMMPDILIMNIQPAPPRMRSRAILPGGEEPTALASANHVPLPIKTGNF